MPDHGQMTNAAGARLAPDTGSYDLIIIGAGPAGMTAAVYAARKQIPTLLVSGDVGGQVLLTAHIENYMGYQFITGGELMEKFAEQVNRYPLDQRLEDKVTLIRKHDESGFSVETAGGGNYQGRAVIVATGKRSRPLNVPGEKEMVGRGVSYCATCDAPFFRDLEVAVIGGGNSAMEAALDLMKIAREVHLVHRSHDWRADAVLLDQVLSSDRVRVHQGFIVREIKGDKIKGVEVLRIAPQDGGPEQDLPVQGVFIEIGLIPNTDVVRGLAELNEEGEMVVDCQSRTSVPGLFAAGDVTNVPEKQIVVAAGEGAKAALTAFRYLTGTR